jgi:hypothetical protein
MDVDYRPYWPILQRFARERVVSGLASMPVVFLTGPRQAGKSTLVRQLLNDNPKRAYLTLDDALLGEFHDLLRDICQMRGI